MKHLLSIEDVSRTDIERILDRAASFEAVAGREIKKVPAAVLADRGHRELPIRPDYVGKNLPTSVGERVNVRVEELDGVDEVTVTSEREALAA